MAENFRQMMAHVTGGRRYCFVIMTYDEGYAFFKTIKGIVSQVTGFECIRADGIPNPGEDLRGKVHAAIDNAAFVIADLTQLRANIYYEVGYATARNKPLLLVAKPGVDIPTDLRGLELIEYTDDRPGQENFEKRLREYLEVHKDSNVSLLCAMLLPRDPRRSFIVVNPKKPTAASRFQHHPREVKTYGDYLGVVGILGAFAAHYGEDFVPQLVSAPHAPEDLWNWDADIYSIGSPKVNPFTATFLKAMQKGPGPNWRFEKAQGEDDLADAEWLLCGDLDSGPFKTPVGRYGTGNRRGVSDYGLILRGPHPVHPNRMVTVLAGPHSLGTGAACLAATKSLLVRQIGEHLAGKVDLADRERTIWSLVRGVAADDLHIDPSGVTIENAGVLV